MSVLACLNTAFTPTHGRGVSCCSTPWMLPRATHCWAYAMPQMGTRRRRQLRRPRTMASKRDHPAPVLLLSPSPVPPSTPNHHPSLSHPLPATHLALSTAIQGLLAPQGHTGPAFLPGRERFIWLQVQGQQALGRGVLGSRLLGGSGRQWGEAGQGHGVFPSQDAGSRWEPSLGPLW